MNGHLVTVKVGVKGRTGQRVKLNGAAFNQQGLKGLNTQAVQSWSTVQQDGTGLDDFFQDFPYFGPALFNNAFGTFYVGCIIVGYQARNHKGAIQF